MTGAASDGTPVWGFNPRGHCGDFARLVPTSPLARLAFSNLVQKLRDDPQSAPNARRFIHYEEAVSPGSDTELSDTSSSGGRGSSRGDIRWVGYWRLNLDIAPAHPRLGWVLGSSRKKKTGKDDDVDLLLTSAPGAHHVAGRHFRFALHPETAVLLAVADAHSVTVNSTPLKHAQQALVSDAGIWVEDLCYKLHFTDLDRDAHVARVLQLFSASSATPVAASSLTPTPLSAPYRQGGYDIYPAKAGGTYGTVSYGINTSTGDSVAVKRIRRTAKNFGVIENEIEILQLLRHPNICYLENVHYPSGKRSPTSFQPGECDEVILFTRPVAQTTLFNYIGAPLEAAHFKPILQQSLSALAHLHSQNIMHRDIKPGNMTITMYQSIKICIIDMGSGLIGTTSTDHMVGTIPYLAPEVIDLKQDQSAKPYTMAADVWSLGITLIEVFFNTRSGWDLVDRTAYSKLVNRVKLLHQQAPVIEETMLGTLLDMISWDPDKRPTSAEAERSIARLELTRGNNEAPAPQKPPAPRLDQLISLFDWKKPTE